MNYKNARLLHKLQWKMIFFIYKYDKKNWAIERDTKEYSLQIAHIYALGHL